MAMLREEPSIVGARSLGLSEGGRLSEVESSRPVCTQKTSFTTTLKSQHPLEDHDKLRSCVRLLDAKMFAGLPNPLPRAQDLPEEYFGSPSVGDQVISVSHAWRNQAHPDPTCHKTKLTAQMLSKFTNDASSPCAQPLEVHEKGREPRVFLFLDFISIPQKPFRLDQEPRTPSQTRQFRAALQCMHEVYFYSDRIIHLPWENAPVPGEGVELTVPAAELQAAVFAQVGDAVQVADITGNQATLTSPHPAHLFDHVVSVDDQVIESPIQLEELLRTGATMARLRSFPFGMSSSIPADARGWVFLERFITMVKCAMVDEETAKKIVITPNEAILQEIMNGASRLREAATQDLRSRRGAASHQELKSRRSEKLKRVLEIFTEELHSKQFTPASTDKRELQRQSTSSIGEDRNIVHAIMEEFVAHLAEHWDAEAAKQRSFATRLSAVVAATEGFLLDWDCFSEKYAAELASASKANPWPVAILACVPFVVLMFILLFPYAHPDEDWTKQTSFWACSSLAWFFASLVFPIFLAHSAGVLCSATVYFRFFLWALAVVVITQLAAVSAAKAWDVFPIPFNHFVCATAATAILPVLWWCIPRDIRASSTFRVRLFYSLVALTFVIVVLALCVPFLNASIPHLSEGWQMVLVGGYLAIKLLFEGLGTVLSRHLGADAMTYFVFWATYAYQVTLCVAFSQVSSWLIVVEQICFDVLENLYHLWSIRSPRNKAQHEQYIVASLVLREFVEVMVPVQFLIMQWLVKEVRPEYSVLLCNKSGAEVQHTESILQVDISVELIVSCITYFFLVRRGHSPLLLLRGLVATRLVPMVLIAGIASIYYCCMQHTHWGMDLSFRFQWVTEAEATWQCGLTWHVPG